jgi:hypothetical protein
MERQEQHGRGGHRIENPEVSSRHLTATVLGTLAGAGGFATLMLAGWLLYRRLWGDSPTALLVIVLVFGAAGLYAGWLLGVIVFSALRGSDDGEETAA